MNSIKKKIILPILMAGMIGFGSCNNENKPATSIRIEGVKLEGIIGVNGATFLDDGVKGYDAIIGKGGFSYYHFTPKTDSVNEYSVIISDSTQKYLTRLREDIRKIEEFTSKDFEKYTNSQKK
ncbi:MAG: hypothetical protein WC758_02885 [Candidatus Woesearchaeota archaeon]|jgi:hypothetical protein